MKKILGIILTSALILIFVTGCQFNLFGSLANPNKVFASLETSQQIEVGEELLQKAETDEEKQEAEETILTGYSDAYGSTPTLGGTTITDPEQAEYAELAAAAILNNSPLGNIAESLNMDSLVNGSADGIEDFFTADTIDSIFDAMEEAAPYMDAAASYSGNSDSMDTQITNAIITAGAAINIIAGGSILDGSGELNTDIDTALTGTNFNEDGTVDSTGDTNAGDALTETVSSLSTIYNSSETSQDVKDLLNNIVMGLGASDGYLGTL